MIKIRYDVFETNSSSVHTLCVAQNDEIDKLKNDELLVNLGWNRSDYLITYEDALHELIDTIYKYGHKDDVAIIDSGDKEEIYRLMYEYDIAERFDRYLETEYLEPYEEEFTTENGDRVLIFGRFGMS